MSPTGTWKRSGCHISFMCDAIDPRRGLDTANGHVFVMGYARMKKRICCSKKKERKDVLPGVMAGGRGKIRMGAGRGVAGK